MRILTQKAKGFAINNRKKSIGFTLIELIAVIVILSVLSTIGIGFVVSTTESYQRTQTRALLVNTSRQALERMTRQLRIALPYSVVAVNSDSCIKFLPIVAGGNYFNPVPDIENDPAGVAPLVPIPASPVVVDFGSPQYVTIGAMSADELYNTVNTSITGYGGYSGGALQLNPAKRWQRNSINKRYYLLDNPQAFCVVGNELRFYEGINLNSTDVDVTDGHSIIARNVSVVNPLVPKPFSLEEGSENRHTQVKIELIFSSGGESITFNQGVFIRNVP